MSTTSYIESKLDGMSYCKSNGRFARHLKQHGLTLRDYYETYISGVTPLCYCLKPTTFYKEGSYANSCGDPVCVGKTVSDAKQNLSDEERDRASANYKAAQLSKSTEKKAAERAKAKQTYFEKYGVEWASSTSQKTKAQNTKLEKYGTSTYNNSQASSEKNRNKTDIEQDAINQRRRATNLKVHGVENTFLKAGIKSKVASSNSQGREFLTPSGKIIWVRGYEDTAIIKLLETYHEDELIVDDMLVSYNLPTFEYQDHRRHNLKYYPDIYIPKENKIIEIKSRWWWDGNGAEKYKSRLSNNLKKRQAVLAKGYTYELWLFEDKNNYKVLTNDRDF